MSKKTKLSTELNTLLAGIVAASQTPDGFLFAPEKDVNALAAAKPGSILVNKGQTDDSGNIAVRASNEELASVAKSLSQENKSMSTAIVAIAGLARPAKNRGVLSQGSSYPFETMKVDDAFFVANTEARPDAAKSIASTVGSANRRYEKSAKVGEAYRNFGVYRGTNPADESVQGALVFRESDKTMTAELRAKLDAPKSENVVEGEQTAQ